MGGEQTLIREPLRPREVRPAGWWFDALLLAGLVALTVALAEGYLLDLDVAVHDWSTGHRPAAAYWTARIFNYLGQGGWLLTPVATGLAVLIGLRTRSIRPFLLVGAALMLTYLVVGPVKLGTDRAAPSSELLAPKESVRIFNDLPPSEYDLSYPSGHVANTIVWYGVIALLIAVLLRVHGRPDLPRSGYLAIRALPPAIVFVTTTYLSFHWVTDSVAGLLLGLLVGRLLTRVPWDGLWLPALPGGLDRPAGLGRRAS